jgi:hypothetical protein
MTCIPKTACLNSQMLASNPAKSPSKWIVVGHATTDFLKIKGHRGTASPDTGAIAF